MVWTIPSKTSVAVWVHMVQVKYKLFDVLFRMKV